MPRRADFGPIVIESDIDDAVLGQLRKWLPSYLRELERVRDLGAAFALPRQESYTAVLEDAEFADHRLPAILVTTAQLAADPECNGDGVYYAAWQVVVTAVTRGRTSDEARRVAAMFGGCVRAVLVQHQSLEGFAGETRWTAPSSVTLVEDPSGNGRFLAAAVNSFTVYVDEVLCDAAGPTLLPGNPYQNDPSTPDVPYDGLATVVAVTTDVHERG